jgi:hypothetical protein
MAGLEKRDRLLRDPGFHRLRGRDADCRHGLRFGSRLGEQARERSELVAGVALILVATILLVLKLLNI